jgi:GNAT superfamily N-acetyltransferase
LRHGESIVINWLKSAVSDTTSDMITTRFLTHNEYNTYGDWLKSQDSETLNLYFGIPMNHSGIDQLIERINKDPSHHEFLIAEQAGKRVGVVHIAICKGEVEFGIIVDKKLRGQKVGSKLLSEAILWARNRRFHNLYMHCLSWNQPIKHLCHKHGLNTTSMYGESEVRVELPPPTFGSLVKEATTKQTQIWYMMLENMTPLAHS